MSATRNDITGDVQANVKGDNAKYAAGHDLIDWSVKVDAPAHANNTIYRPAWDYTDGAVVDADNTLRREVARSDADIVPIRSVSSG